MSAMSSAAPTHLFVYGTLRPGEVRWQHLEPYVDGDGIDTGIDTSVAGELYDTGLQYPAAMFGGDARILGRVYPLASERVSAALAHLDEVEGAVRGLYHRVVVATESGHDAWAYQCGDPTLLVRRIPSGDWLHR
jgi:gamma-glutamylcyclotransferase (GGCT)/AIG2-like uncharacterized protein YtfP